jgi:hypothetical protein
VTTYRTPDNVWQELLESQQQVLRRWVLMVREGIELAGRDSRAGERLAEHADFIEFAAVEMPLVVERWQKAKESRTPREAARPDPAT